MILRNLIIFCFLLQATGVIGQNPSLEYGNLITPGDLKENLTILSADALEGRETGTRGQKMAAAFISYHFQELGLKPPVNGSFYQPFPLYKNIPGEVFVRA